MCAYVFRVRSSRSHFSTLRPKPIELNSTARLCHITPVASGTSPRCLRLSRFSSHPDRPVIYACGSRGVLVMLGPPVDAIDMKTPPALRL